MLIELLRHFGESPNKSGDPLGPFPTISPVVLIGSMNRKIHEIKLPANRKQGQLLGLSPTVICWYEGVFGGKRLSRGNTYTCDIHPAVYKYMDNANSSLRLSVSYSVIA